MAFITQFGENFNVRPVFQSTMIHYRSSTLSIIDTKLHQVIARPTSSSSLFIANLPWRWKGLGRASGRTQVTDIRRSWWKNLECFEGLASPAPYDLRWYSSNIGIAGLNNAGRTETGLRRCFWLVIFIAGLSGTLHSTMLVLQEFFEYPIETTVRIADQPFVITVPINPN